MSSSQPQTGCHFGFISIVDLGSDTVIGGYLIVNSMGRPVEFHCTEPVKPNRAQQILYGATLRPFLFGDHIGKTLFQHGKTRPTVIFTDVLDVVTMRSAVDLPLLCVGDFENASQELIATTVADVTAYVDARFADDARACQKAFASVASAWDLIEPFERIHEAVSEIQKAA